MGIETAIEYADQLLYERTGKHLSDLQSYILQQSWQGKTYGQVATLAGYSEGHVKDVASQLWKLLSEALGERITKGNLRARLKNRIKRTLQSAPGSATVLAGIRGVQAQIDRHGTPVHTQIAPAPQQTHLTDGFIGRQSALQTLDSLSQNHQIIVIKGEGGIGKTTLAQQYAQRFDQVLELLMAKETASITPIESVVEEWLRQSFNEEPGREFGITLSRLKHHLQAGCRAGRICVLIDNLEPALDSNGQFVAEHRHYVELLRVLSAAQATVLITSRDRLCEPGIKVHHYRLPGLAAEAWRQFFVSHGIDLALRQHIDVLSKMHQAYSGNAKAMEILCAAAIEDFEGDLTAYWQENSANLLGTADLRNLVGSQVNRLQQLDTDAYRLFCRLGCYRYQEQSRLKAGAIAALMWDIDPSIHQQTINSLRDRSLLDCRKGIYWLHPVSRAEAIARLRNSQDWQPTNRAAATYWSAQVQSIASVNDALQALEAYYHLIAIGNYDGAAAVLLKSRHNQWRQFLPLASSLYRMGLLQPAITTITQVLPRVKTSQSELNNILGDVHWIMGDVHSAIACQQKTLADTAKRTENLKAQKSIPMLERDTYALKMLTVDAHLSIGLYQIDLWELEQAAEQFETVIAIAANTPHQAWADKATVGLALVQAHLGNTPAAITLANSIEHQFTAGPDDEHGRYAYFLQLLGQTFGQLGFFERAKNLYERAIQSAETGHYVQVKARALTGLAVLYRHRYQAQLDNQATEHQGKISTHALHDQAIELCQAIGATCDLAEAYFQRGCTTGEADCFERAIALFKKIKAPCQIKRCQIKRCQIKREENAAS